MTKKVFKIKGMHCVSCAMSIDGELEDTDGVRSASTNYSKEECEVEFDEKKVKIEKLFKAIRKTGYSAEMVSKNLI